ncbi:hypothetical protein KJ682_16245 [bacterium]|nr:hypothetical protein [bacterium]
METAPRRAFLVSHTHWDREWYLTRHRFHVDLVAVVDRILDALDDDPAYRHFVLDGQTAVLEDYLATVPERTDRVRALISTGRLSVGPWFILPDEFLVSGEATVRNLRFGARTPAAAGRIQPVGYMPDSFGHVAQLPQILRLAGLDSFIFTRGLGDEAADLGWLFRWAAPDGSEVLAVNQCEGYCNAGGLGFAEIWHAHTRRKVETSRAVERVSALFAAMAGRAGADPALLNNGCDHFPPQQDFGAVMAALAEAFPATEWRHGSFMDFLDAARGELPDQRRPRHAGELLGSRDHPILSGVWSARMYLKQQNERCQTLLTRCFEPAAAGEHFLAGGAWPGGLLQDAWRTLLLNHPHDSICGCSIDAVHLDMETRFAAVRQTAEQWLSRFMDRLAPLFGTTEEHDRSVVVSVLNPLPFRRSEVVDRLLVLQPLGFDLDHLRLVDEQGREVPCEILDRRFVERFWGIDYRRELSCDDQLDQLQVYLDRFGDRILGDESDRDTRDCFVHLRFLAADLPACGHARFFLRDDRKPAPPQPEAPVLVSRSDEGAVLDNGIIAAVLHPDGTIDLGDRRSGRTWSGLNLLEDREDRGDEYDWCPCPTGGQVFSAGCEGKVVILDRGGLKGAAETRFRWSLPRALRPDRLGREDRTVPCDVTVRIELDAGGDRLDVTTWFSNRARDHRLRAWFPTGLETGHVVSDGHFYLNRRPLERPRGDNWAQPAPATWPQQDFSLLDDGSAGLAILNRGLPEFETWAGPDGGAVFALTLLRCVDWLSRDDLPTRNDLNAGPTLFTPGAQCLDAQVFHYALMPFAGDPLAAGIREASERFRTPPLTGQGVAEGGRPGGGSLLEKTDPRTAVTAVTRAEKGGRLLVRLYNQSPASTIERLDLGFAALDALKLGILEDPLPLDRDPAAVVRGGRQIVVPLAPHEIATVAIEPATEEDQ